MAQKPVCTPPVTARWPRLSEREAAVFEGAEGVADVGAGEHLAAAVGPVEGLGRGDAAMDLEDAALEDAVLGPGAGEVLHAGHLDPRPVAGGGEAADAVAVGVAGEVAGQA